MKTSAARSFRWSAAWQAKRAEIKKRDRGLCRVCLKNGVKCREAQVYHITPIDEDYSQRLRDSNLITLCTYHHERAEAGQISRAELHKIAAATPKTPD